MLLNAAHVQHDMRNTTGAPNLGKKVDSSRMRHRSVVQACNVQNIRAVSDEHSMMWVALAIAAVSSNHCNAADLSPNPRPQIAAE